MTTIPSYSHVNGRPKTKTHRRLEATGEAPSDDPLWQALFNGHFRLALRCDVCGRYLTATESKRAGRGPTCRARVEGVR
jgi:hypothetical protein